MQYGMEVEFFLTKRNMLVFPKDYGFGHDGYPLIGELRSEPHTDPYKMVGEVMGLLAKARHKAAYAGLRLHLQPHFLLTDAMKVEVMRRPELNKGAVTSLNLYEYDDKLDPNFAHAGIHIHFSGRKQVVHYGRCEHCGHVPYESITFSPSPIPEIIKRLDRAFVKEISKAERVAGEYEMKSYGFEYRSLPNNTDLEKIAKVLDQECGDDMLSRKAVR